MGGALPAAAFREMALSYLACWQDEFASSFEWGWGLSVYPIILFSPSLFEESHINDILLTGTLSLQSNKNTLELHYRDSFVCTYSIYFPINESLHHELSTTCFSEMNRFSCNLACT